MTPNQTKRAIEIMQKHGQEGWKIEYKSHTDKTWSLATPDWIFHEYLYRAVGPRKRVELKRGMEVKNADGHTGLIIMVTSGAYPFISAWDDRIASANNGKGFTHYRWPNGDGEWLPIEGEPEIISMEDVE